MLCSKDQSTQTFKQYMYSTLWVN